MNLSTLIPLSKVLPFVFALSFGIQSDLPAPPMKSGLWESSNSVHMTNVALASPKPVQIVMKSRICITFDTWLDSFYKLPKDCIRQNVSSSDDHYSADLVCSTQQSKGTGHLDIQFKDADSAHAKVDMDSDTPPQHIIAHNVIDMHFLSESCGDVTPGHPAVIH